MPSYAAFLRGMNLGGRRITNAELECALSALDLTEVATFRASGNVAFHADEASLQRLARRIEEGLHEALGYEVPTYLRTAEQVRTIAAHRPFPDDVVLASRGKLQVGMLFEPPSASAARSVLERSSEDDRLAFGERELYWLPSGGISESELDLKAIAGLVGEMTLRTKGTVEQMAGRLFDA